jgi:hypothetical protein
MFLFAPFVLKLQNFNLLKFNTEKVLIELKLKDLEFKTERLFTLFEK